jgi:hypothetical protein
MLPNDRSAGDLTGLNQPGAPLATGPSGCYGKRSTGAITCPLNHLAPEPFSASFCLRWRNDTLRPRRNSMTTRSPRLTIGGRQVLALPDTIVLMPASLPHAIQAGEPSRMLLIMLREPTTA